MNLPFDIARCGGTTAPLCQQCRRREPGRDYWQTYIEPKWNTAGCENYIGSVITVTTAGTTTDERT